MSYHTWVLNIKNAQWNSSSLKQLMKLTVLKYSGMCNPAALMGDY